MIWILKKAQQTTNERKRVKLQFTTDILDIKEFEIKQ